MSVILMLRQQNKKGEKCDQNYNEEYVVNHNENYDKNYYEHTNENYHK